MTRNRVSKPVRVLISLVIGFVLSLSTLFDFVAVLLDHLPRPIVWFLNLPAVLYCYHLMATEPLPADDIPIFQAGQAAQCFFVGIPLNIPWYALLIYLGWWFVDLLRERGRFRFPSR